MNRINVMMVIRGLVGLLLVVVVIGGVVQVDGGPVLVTHEYLIQQIVEEDVDRKDFGRASQVSKDGRFWAVGSKIGEVVSIYRNDSGKYVLEQRINAPDGATDLCFGCGLGIHGNMLAIGASTVDKVFVYERSGSKWSLMQTLDTSANQFISSDSGFGSSIIMTESELLVSAPKHLQREGAVVVFTRSGDQWKLKQNIRPRGRARVGTRTQFGGSLALDDSGETLAIGAPAIGAMLGDGYVFQKTADGFWDEVQMLQPSVQTSTNDLGVSIGFQKGQIIIGARAENTRAGAAYVFERDGNQFVEVARLLDVPPEEGSAFGYSVAIENGLVAVGGIRNKFFYESENATYPTGVIQIYRQEVDANEWSHIATIGSPFPSPDVLQMGRQVEIRNGNLFVSCIKCLGNGVGLIYDLVALNRSALDPIRVPPPGPLQTLAPTPSNGDIVQPEPITELVCARYNRMDGDSNTTCGDCLPFFIGRPGPSTGKCRFWGLKMYQVTTPLLNPFSTVNVGQEAKATFADLNGDGLEDMIAGQVQTYARIFLNRGTKHKPLFVEATEPGEKPFGEEIQYEGRLSAADWDGDGIPELIGSSAGTDMEIFYATPRKLENGKIEYVRETDLARNPFHGLKMPFQARPGCAAVNLFGKQTLDLICGIKTGQVLVYKNQGNETSPSFEPLTGSANPFDGFTFGAGSEPHASVTCADVDKDGDIDCLIGDYDGYLSYVRNDGNMTHPKFTKADGLENLFRDVESILLSKKLVRISPTFWDYNGDGNMDLVIGVLSGEFLLFRNDQNGGNPVYSMATGSSDDPFRMVRLSKENLVIRCTDIDGDEDLDCFACDSHDEPVYLKNIGNAGDSFYERRQDESPFRGLIGPCSDMQFIDIDGDADVDVFIGTFDGKIAFYENVNGTFVAQNNKNNPLGSDIIDLGSVQYVHFQFVRLDTSRNTSDVVITLDKAEPIYLENVGTVNAARFLKKQRSPFKLPTTNAKWLPFRTNFAFLDVDYDGDLDVVIGGSGDGQGPYGDVVWVWRNDGNSTYANFTEMLVDMGSHPFGQFDYFFWNSVELIDADGDQDLDAIFLLDGGVITFLENVATDCASNCATRGLCGNSWDPRLDPFSRIIALNHDVDPGAAGGKCLCSEVFMGESCQQCIETNYGVNCEKTCPDNSATTFGANELVYPQVSTIEDCKCKETFVKQRNGQDQNRDFTCTCPKGAFLNPRLNICEPCPIGYYKDHEGIGECSRCDEILGAEATTIVPGAINASQCQCTRKFLLHENKCVCPSGTFGDTTIGCNVCSKERPFTNGPGQLNSSACLTGPGSFVILPEEVSKLGDGGEHRSCPLGARCDTPGITLSSLPILSGYWRISTKSLDIRKCEYSSYCNPETNKIGDDGHPNRRVLLNTTDMYCTPHHTGVLCSKCELGYAIKGGVCTECTDEEEQEDIGLLVGWIIFGSIFVIVLPVGRLIYLGLKSSKGASGTTNSSTSPKKSLNRKRTSKINQAALGFSQRVFAYFPGTKIRIFLGFVQVFMQYTLTLGYFGSRNTGDVQENTSTSSNGFFAFVSTLTDFDFSGMRLIHFGCAFDQNQYTALYVRTIVPIVSLSCISLTTCIFKNHHSGSNFANVCGAAVWMGLNIMFLVYPGVSVSIFQTFLYEGYAIGFSDDDGMFFTLRTDPSVDFDSGESFAARIYAGLMVVVYPIGILVAFYAAIRYRAKVIAKEPDNSKVEENVAKMVSFITAPYTKDWFELYEFVRKLLLTSLFLLIEQASHEIAIAAFIIMVVAFIVALLVIKPYRKKSDHQFALTTMLMLFALSTVPIIERVYKEFEEQQELGLILTITIFAMECVSFIIAWTFQSKFPDPSSSDSKSRNQATNGTTKTEEHESGDPTFVQNNNLHEEEPVLNDSAGVQSEIMVDENDESNMPHSGMSITVE